jgi:hypothetical protein
MEQRGPLYLLVLLLMVPFMLLRDLLRCVSWIMRKRAHWQSIPLQKRSQIRATAGAFIIVAVIGAMITGRVPLTDPAGLWSVVGLLGVGFLYLLVGIFGPRFRFDLMSVFYWSLTALACAALLVFEGVIR